MIRKGTETRFRTSREKAAFIKLEIGWRKRNVSIKQKKQEDLDSLRQSTIFFIVAVLVLIWFGAEAFPGQQICATSCISLKGMNIAEEVAAVAILPILIVLAGINQRRSEKQKEKVKPSEQTQDKKEPDSEKQAP